MTDAEAIDVPAPYGDRTQRDIANHLGMWTLIATEVILFGGLFLAYLVYRLSYPAAFSAGSHRLDFWSGTENTAVLLTSSLFMALGDAMIKRGNRRALQGCLAITASLGLLFLAIKFSEYHQMYREGLIPGVRFDAVGAPQIQLFLLLYFVMTALHAVHMLVGIGTITWLLRLNHRGHLSSGAHAPVSMVGLYWHFVDCVWVFLYPLLYLIPR
jgi:cytochrome c oxidase subunit 3